MKPSQYKRNKGLANLRESSSEPPPFSLDRYLPQIMNLTAASFNKRLSDELKAIDLPLANWRILAILAWKGRCTLSEISQYTVIEISTLSRAIARLEGDKLIQRDWHTNDARFRAIELTKAGALMFTKAWSIVWKFQSDASKGISPEDLETARRVLDTIRANLGSTGTGAV